MKIDHLRHYPCVRSPILYALTLMLAFIVTARADYKSTVLAGHPVGFWPLDETSGNIAADLSGNDNNGIYEVGVAPGGAGLPNPPFVGFAGDDSAASFSGYGNNSWITLTNLPINSATVTITEWIYPTEVGSLGTTFWNYGQNAGLSRSYFNNAALGYNWHGGSGGQWTYSAFVPPVNQWSFVAMVITPTNTVFYMGNTDGFSWMINNDGNSAADFTTGTTIGGDGRDDGSGFNGSLSHVAVFDYSLTPDQVAQLFVAGSGLLLPPPAPADLSAAAGNAQVSLSWSTSAGATGYNLKRATTSGAEETIASLIGTSYTDSGLANGTTYYYQVSAINSAGESVVSTEVSATPSGAITNYSAGVLALNPVGFWPLNETSGATAFDVSGNDNNGAYETGVTLGGAGIPNPPFAGFTANNHAAGFSGAVNNSWVTLTNLPINSDKVTITEWIYPTNANNVGTTFWNAGQNAGFSRSYFNGAALGYNWHGGDGSQWTYSAFSPPVNQWSFVAMVITPSNAVFYIGNASGLSSVINNNGNSAVDFTTGTTIGGDGVGNSGLNGSLSHVAVFDYALTPAQITQLYAGSGANDLPPIITEQPVSHSGYTNGATSFRAKAIGAAPLSYQWWHGATLLADQTNALLTINGLTAADIGEYSVVVANNFGAVTSSVATLTLAAMPLAYQNLIVSDHPVGYWPLDLNVDTGTNSSGQYRADDLSGNGNAGTYESMSQAVNQVVGPSAYLPSGASFNGSTAFVDLSTGTNASVLNIGGQIAMEAWVQPDVSQARNPAEILAKGPDYVSPGSLNHIGLTDGDIVGGRDSGYTLAGSVAYTNWTHVVCTYDGAQWNLYLNAVLTATAEDPQGASLDNIPWAIANGTSGGSGRYFKGNIAQVALYAVGLTPGQVSAHYAMGRYGTTQLTPIINRHPLSQRVMTNTTARFTVGAIGSPVPTYQWYSVIDGTTNLIADATDDTYTTPPVRDGDSGHGYFVIVSNASGSTTSDVAILTAGHVLALTGYLESAQYHGNYANVLDALGSVYPTAATLPTPDRVDYLQRFTSNESLPDNSVERIHGWFTPPTSGNYVFFVASDDASTLWLSTDSDPANVYQIAQNQAWMWNIAGPDWTCANIDSAEYAYFGTGEWRSEQFEINGGPNAYAWLNVGWSPWPGLNPDGSIPLTGGTSYYIELDHYQGSGGQNAAVTYKLAGDPDPDAGAATLLTGDVISALVPDSSLPLPQPVFTDVQSSGTNRILSGNNGLVNAVYRVLTSTNLSAPLADWTVLATQRFNADGSFSVTHAVTAEASQRFYLIQMPN